MALNPAYKMLPLAAIAGLVLVFATIQSGSVGRIQAAGEVLYGVAPDGTNCISANALALFTIDTSTGSGTFVGCLVLLNLGSVSAIELNLNSGVLYGTGSYFDGQSESIALFTINTSTGAATIIGSTGLSISNGNITDLSFRNSDNILFGHFQNRNVGGELHTINTSTGAATLVGATGEDQRGNSIAHSPTDTLYYIGDDEQLYSLNQGTGAATDLLITLDFTDVTDSCPQRMSAMDLDPGTGTLYGVIGANQETGGPNCLLTISTSTGVVTEIGLTVSFLEAIAFSPGTGGTPTPTATRTTAPSLSSTPTRTPTITPTATVTTTPLVEEQRARAGGAVGAIGAVAGAQARDNRPGVATAVAGSGVVVPPNTGDGGLKQR